MNCRLEGRECVGKRVDEKAAATYWWVSKLLLTGPSRGGFGKIDQSASKYVARKGGWIV